MTGVQTCALPISPKPQNPKTPKFDLENKHSLKLSFKLFVREEEVELDLGDHDGTHVVESHGLPA